jgi:formyl-CoA transferase
VPGPLNGVRVVEVANWTFVPAAGAVLADLGADVIKIEPPNGDPQRALRNLLNLSDDGPNPFLEIPNRGKRSVTCDLTTDDGRRALAAILAGADVFVTSNLAPIRDKLHINVEDVRAANPDIIYVRGTGWGNEGPMAEVGGYDMACGWASSGMAYKMTRGGIEPLPQPAAFFDLQGANTIAGAIGMALYKRATTGETSVVDVSLMHVGMWAMSPDIVGAPFSGDNPSGGDRTKSPNPLVNGYATKDDRWVYFVCLQPDRFWDEFCTLLGRPDLITNERYADPAGRYQNRTELILELDRVFATLTLDEIKEKFTGFSGVWAPVLRPSELYTHPQVEINGFLPRVAATSGSDFNLVAAPMHFSGHTTEPPGPRPSSDSTPKRCCSRRGWTGMPSARCGRAADWADGGGAPASPHDPRRHHDQGSRSSTSPQALAVAASIVLPENASHAVRRRPTRRVRLTVPPAPGTRPRPISGRAIRVSAAATTRSANAASSMPDPTQAPCT